MSSLPPIPPPPETPDPEAAGAPAPGYPPGAPDLARLQEAMQRALGAVPAHLLRPVWRREGVAWGWAFLKAWVRGLRRADLELHGGRIEVRFTTSGPGGRYEFAFSIRPAGRPPELQEPGSGRGIP